jgi:hypothetical protein
MSIERRFLGWHRPALHLAAEFLYGEFHQGNRWDMSSVAVALPGARAGRRLRELLAIRVAELSEGGAHVIPAPPRFLTVGDLPKLFYSQQIPIATNMEALLAWAEALRRMPANSLRELFPGVAREPDPSTLCALAGEALAIDQELAAECISSGDLAAYCASRGQGKTAARWIAFAEAQHIFRQVLSETGRISRDQARADALQRELRADRTIVIVAGADLPAITRRMLLAAKSRIVALVHAPQEEAGGFDETGSLITQHWESAPIALPEHCLEIADFPRDQALATAKTLESLPDLSAGIAAVGVCEETLATPIERAIELSGKRARRATGMRLSLTGPAQLLRLLAAYSRDHRAEHFAALIRHPDLNDWLVRTLGWPEEAGPWPQLCDQFIADRLPVAIDRETKNLPADLAGAVQAIGELLGKDPGARRALAECVTRIVDLLGQVYKQSAAFSVPPLPPAGEELGVRADAGEGPGVRANPALDLLVAALADVSDSVTRNGSLRLTLAEAVDFLLAACGAQSVPAQAGMAQIDLFGWLEAHLDDAPMLVLAGFNEGSVPQSVPSDPFLPDSLRRDLGLLDNKRRYARDAYLFRAILASKQVVRVICGRFGAQNEPLAPSRLLLAGGPDEVIRRVLDFYGRDAQGSAESQPPAPAEPYPLAAIPRPRRMTKSLSKLRVTAFRDYLACPYRFYLKHVLGLGAVDDNYVEMRPDSFGDLLHKVLQDFGHRAVKEWEGRPPANPDTISRYLRDSLDRRARARFGESMRPSVEIQVELLGRRLEAFARFQAAETDAGWVVLATERPLEAELVVDGSPFLITGRIDRIDYHPGHGLYRILDYKSRDGGCDPEGTHRDSECWIDLQLPLYKRLAALIDLDQEIDQDSLEVGYIALPRDAQKIGYLPAPWTEDEFYEAYLLADEIIRKIRAQEFWPPNLTPPALDDGFAAICLDKALDRQAIIELDSGSEALWSDRDAVEAGHGD